MAGDRRVSEVFDATRCALGEGPLWHPEREQLFWFDILNHRLLTQENGKTRIVQFDEHVSAAGWVSDTELLIASESRLLLFDLEREKAEDVEGLEPDNALTRSNDGRADPWGGFWIGTMAKDQADHAGAIYRYYNGRLTKLHHRLSIPNAICFSPDRKFAYFTDTPTQMVKRQRLESDRGWPDGEAEVWLDLSADDVFPDGAVVDAKGVFWNAQWGAGRVAAYSPDAKLVDVISFNAANTTCPAFGGTDLSTLFCTSATKELTDIEKEKCPDFGRTFAAPETGRGQPEHRVKL
ncbi:MAG: SMP-30/gluconolactonase/LRE family protein [Pseudomonadota bacterium]